MLGERHGAAGRVARLVPELRQQRLARQPVGPLERLFGKVLLVPVAVADVALLHVELVRKL